MRKDISIVHIKSSTGIDSENHLLTFDYKAGESMKPITCVCTFYANQNFLDELEASKIVSIQSGSFYSYPSNGISAVCSFTLLPKFSYTNQKLEDIMCNLFEKYKL